MAYKQPKVPPMTQNTQLAAYIRELVLFLKDFCLETWMQARRQEEEIRKLKEEIRAGAKAGADGE